MTFLKLKWHKNPLPIIMHLIRLYEIKCFCVGVNYTEFYQEKCENN